jgi:hypothetical protein
MNTLILVRWSYIHRCIHRLTDKFMIYTDKYLDLSSSKLHSSVYLSVNRWIYDIFIGLIVKFISLNRWINSHFLRCSVANNYDNYACPSWQVTSLILGKQEMGTQANIMLMQGVQWEKKDGEMISFSGHEKSWSWKSLSLRCNHWDQIRTVL